MALMGTETLRQLVLMPLQLARRQNSMSSNNNSFLQDFSAVCFLTVRWASCFPLSFPQFARVAGRDVSAQRFAGR